MSLETVTLDDALKLLTLPRVVGVDPESGEEITAQNGRYGPYLKKGTDSRSIDSEDQLLTITLDEALKIYAEPKQRGRRAAAAPLRELGTDPNVDKPVVVKDGRFGPYVTDGEFNATLRKDDEVDKITLERAVELLAEKRAKGPAPKKRAAKKTARRRRRQEDHQPRRPRPRRPLPRSEATTAARPVRLTGGGLGWARGSRRCLSITSFRRLWIGLGLSSLGDWLGLLALTAMASAIADDNYADQNFAIASVLFLRVLPAIVLGPLAGYIADRLDRRWTLIIGDVLRGLVFASIPFVSTLTWVLIATVIIEAISLVWLPAKDATIPNLVPRSQLEDANRISIATTYGSALPAAALFIVLSWPPRA